MHRHLRHSPRRSRIVEDNAPYIWPTGPTPEQADASTSPRWSGSSSSASNAEFAGDEAMRSEPRRFGCSATTRPNGQYKDRGTPSRSSCKEATLPIAGRFTLLPRTRRRWPRDARTIANRLKEAGVTTIIFRAIRSSRVLTKKVTEQGYFPEWVIGPGPCSPTPCVFAAPSTSSSGRTPSACSSRPRVSPRAEQDAYTLHQWWFGTEPPTENNFASRRGQRRAPVDRDPACRPEPHAGDVPRRHVPPAADVPGPLGLNTIITFGDHGFWDGNDTGGLDNAGILYWDPEATGPDETGNVGKGMYRLLDGGKRYLHDEWPTEPAEAVRPRGHGHDLRSGPDPAGAAAGRHSEARRRTRQQVADQHALPDCRRRSGGHARGHAGDNGVVGHLDAGDDRAARRSRRCGRSSSRATRPRRGRASCRRRSRPARCVHIWVPIGRSRSS